MITGASRGIGHAVAKKFAEEGADLILPVRDEECAEKLVKELSPVGGKILTPVGDLTDRSFFSRLSEAVEKKFQRLDILIASAGELGPISLLSNIDDADWEKVLNINLTANFRLLKTFDPLLRRAKAARLVFVTSGVTRNPGRAKLGPYSLTKCALEAMAKTYACETADTAIRINLLNPGPTRTSMRATVCPDEDPLTVKSPERVAEFFLNLCLPECQDSGRIFDITLDAPTSSAMLEFPCRSTARQN
ncbi:MAG: SDR family oxidoreductase [Alphaproteobacteria bacterium]|nr:SDR family oxidoreductase [Alphaproteobacteria bacterium]